MTALKCHWSFEVSKGDVSIATPVSQTTYRCFYPVQFQIGFYEGIYQHFLYSTSLSMPLLSQAVELYADSCCLLYNSTLCCRNSGVCVCVCVQNTSTLFYFHCDVRHFLIIFYSYIFLFCFKLSKIGSSTIFFIPISVLLCFIEGFWYLNMALLPLLHKSKNKISIILICVFLIKIKWVFSNYEVSGQFLYYFQ